MIDFNGVRIDVTPFIRTVLQDFLDHLGPDEHTADLTEPHEWIATFKRNKLRVETREMLAQIDSGEHNDGAA